MIDIDFITNDQLRAVRDAILVFRSTRAWDDKWGEYEYTEPVLICQLQSLHIALKICQARAADLHDPEFHYKFACAASDCDLARLREHMALEREVRDYLKNLTLSLK